MVILKFFVKHDMEINGDKILYISGYWNNLLS